MELSGPRRGRMHRTAATRWVWMAAAILLMGCIAQRGEAMATFDATKIKRPPHQVSRSITLTQTGTKAATSGGPLAAGRAVVVDGGFHDVGTLPEENVTIPSRIDAVRSIGDPGFGEWTCQGITETNGLSRCQQFCMRTNVSFDLSMGNKCKEKGLDLSGCRDGAYDVADYCCSCEEGGCIPRITVLGRHASTCNQYNGSCVFCGFRNNPKFLPGSRINRHWEGNP